jgi:hypothetical protein
MEPPQPACHDKDCQILEDGLNRSNPTVIALIRPRLHNLRSLAAAVLLSLTVPGTTAVMAQATTPSVQILDDNITLAQVLKAQEGWCKALLQISADYSKGGIAKAKATATQVIDQAYGYQYGPVAFKPTLASGEQTFRTTREGALAYFVGNNPNFPQDKGFALKPWRSCRIVNQVIQLNGSSATTMGNVIFTDATGSATSVDKTWNFVKEPDGSVRIVLHHSSLNYGG